MNTSLWYAVKVKGGQEEKVEGAIKEAFSEAGLVLERSIVPFKKRAVVNRQGKKEMRKRFFSYLFLCMTFDERIKEALRKVKGVYGLVNKDGWGYDDPYPVDPQEIDQMMGHTQGEGSLAPEAEQERYFVKGERVRVIEGPLKEREVVIEEVFPQQKKVKAIIQVFGGNATTKIDLRYSQVEKIS